MRKETGLGVAIAMMLAAGTAQAQVIDLKGTWTGTSEAIFVGPATHHAKPGTAAASHQLGQQPFTFVIEGQEGRRFWGKVSSPGATERIIGSLSVDGKSIYLVDHDGMLDGTVVNADALDVCYRHVNRESALVACLRVTRSK